MEAEKKRVYTHKRRRGEHKSSLFAFRSCAPQNFDCRRMMQRELLLPELGSFSPTRSPSRPRDRPPRRQYRPAAHQLRPTRLFLFSVLSRPCRRVFSSPNHLAISSHQVGHFSLLLQHYYQLNGTVEIDGHAIIAAMIRSPPLPSSTLYIRSTAYYSSQHLLAHHHRRRQERRQAP